ncbi:MAG: hypothetical protein ACOYVF_13370 [Candidatus Zixiibacteriota bacterium]
MRKLIPSIIFVFILCVGTAATAVELKSTPVQNAMEIQLALASRGDEFDQLNRKKTDDVTATENKIETGTNSPKAVWKAGLLSALVPGAGEFYLGNKAKARYFFAAEALTWVGFIAFRTYGSWRKDDYIEYAAKYADAHIGDKDDEFHDLVGFYSSIYEYNTLGRVGDPERAYLEDTPENHWLWDSPEDQATYRALKTSSKDAYNRANFALGVAAIARIISVIDAVRDARKQNQRIDKEFSRSDKINYKFSVNPFSETGQVKFTLYAPF